MGHYKANLRDVEFNLFEVFGRDEILGTGPFADLDVETARTILDEVRALAEGPLAESFTDADRNPPVYDPESKTVTLPESFKKSYRALLEAGWDRLPLPAELGGPGLPHSIVWAANEFVLGANPAIHMYAAGPAFAQILFNLGNADQKKLAQTMIERQWGATMVLTEPDAGSDVGAGRAKATQQPDGTWHVEGVKRFITSAEWDVPENIVHLVLARPEGHGPGTKGLSLFVVPKFLCDWESGELGARNGVYVTNVEKKMGLKVSATCEVTFGEKEPAIGWLVGDVHDGIAQMFKVIEMARMMVGTKAIATLSTGYLNALDFAKSRVQGPDLTQMTDKTAPRVTITRHPDVRRSLLLQKSYAEGMRALMLFAATQQDEVQIAESRGESADDAIRLNDLLLPLVKGVGSERSYELLGSQSLQTLGGSGFLQDYPIEQYIRDAKIDTLYEGTTAIQGMDLFFRKIVRDQGQALTALAAQIQAFADSEAGNGQLKNERELLGRALDDVNAIVGAMVGYLTGAQEDVRSLYKVGLNTSRLLLCLGDLVIGWLLLRQADVALLKLTEGPADRDQAFYEGKVAAAKFFAQTRLPLIAAERVVVEGSNLEAMDLDEAAF
ncbi:MAG TPA: acyl-CoA dehydrogenase [Mycobacteriales bacterium]|jgi:alkylation response protein AidB-like acyl-CoA dehydrogenase|nr:acyl-CoA dehydrogenase [Mycobacteriales bacterium]